MNSIIQSIKECYICGSPIVEEHHIVMGRANRNKSEKYGLKVWLCSDHHRGINGVHGRNGGKLNKYLHELAQSEFEKIHTHDDWMNIFHKSWL